MDKTTYAEYLATLNQKNREAEEKYNGGSDISDLVDRYERRIEYCTEIKKYVQISPHTVEWNWWSDEEEVSSGDYACIIDIELLRAAVAAKEATEAARIAENKALAEQRQIREFQEAKDRASIEASGDALAAVLGATPPTKGVTPWYAASVSTIQPCLKEMERIYAERAAALTVRDSIMALDAIEYHRKRLAEALALEEAQTRSPQTDEDLEYISKHAIFGKERDKAASKLAARKAAGPSAPYLGNIGNLFAGL